MSPAFADTNYWVAISHPRDQWHARALDVSRTLVDRRLVTTEAILIEFLNYFAGYGPYWREQALLRVAVILESQFIEVLPHHAATLVEAMELYGARADKSYSLTDCISMREMRAREIYEVLTSDNHFEQEGFVLLLK